ncbi:hypothetical protein BSZ36_13765 [Rubricoccus marinus]|uniref:Uncharacterized protein n=1 Tax=Rubricoccus marinus TaxID=716817 RepID=A0A259U2C5_9BACT|nr:hypothetical protein BSZ36_13765 [Rubricoccus marinus]
MSARPASGEVHVWTIDLARSAQSGILSADEEEQARRYRFAADGRRFTARRCALRQILGAALGIAPEAIAFRTDAWGKPAVTSGDVGFNLTHAGDHAMIAVARGQAVGVDLERRRPWEEVRVLLPVVCSPAEQELLALAHAPADLFAQLWVWKEAALKASGDGFSRDPRTLDALDARDATKPLWRDGNRLWRLHPLAAPEGYRAAVAAPPDAHIVQRAWPPEA